MPEASRQARITRTQEIADAYRTATLKDAWYGPSLADLLARTSPNIAVTPPAPGAHSISTLLQHILLWNDRVMNTSDSTPMPRWEPEKEWAAPRFPGPNWSCAGTAAGTNWKKKSAISLSRTSLRKSRAAIIRTKNCSRELSSTPSIIPAKSP